GSELNFKSKLAAHVHVRALLAITQDRCAFDAQRLRSRRSKRNSCAQVAVHHRAEISADAFFSGGPEREAAAFKQTARTAQRAHCRHVVTDEQNGAPLAARCAFHFSQTLFLELRIAHSKDFINDENLRL